MIQVSDVSSIMIKVFFMVLCVTVTLSHGGVVGHFGHHLSSGQGQGVSSQSVVRHHGIPDLHQNHLDSIGHDFHHGHHEEQNTYPKYQYNYMVTDDLTEDKKSHWENREGGNVEGQYTLVQPDGSTRTVTYTANDHEGFNAVVETTGGANEHHNLH